jgi:hypothetical protein
MVYSQIQRLPTKPISYKGFAYHIDGSDLSYRWFIRREPDGKLIPSEESFPGVVPCNLAAREQIDLLIGAGVQMSDDEAPIAPQPEGDVAED